MELMSVLSEKVSLETVMHIDKCQPIVSVTLMQGKFCTSMITRKKKGKEVHPQFLRSLSSVFAPVEGSTAAFKT
jgi:hypothetical protein